VIVADNTRKSEGEWGWNVNVGTYAAVDIFDAADEISCFLEMIFVS
jgi:hypothetical protein